LQEAGLLGDAAQKAGASDVMVVVVADTKAALDAAFAHANEALHSQAAVASGDAQSTLPAKALQMWLAGQADEKKAFPNLVQISVPGPYAAAEGLKAVSKGLNVFMFSDNVPLAQEIALKKAAKKQGVLVMGPDCGTAILNGVPLGFANVVARGNIGLVAASGTGLQEVTTQIHRMGGGVSQAIGTGGRDVYAAVGGITMLQGIALLAKDAATQVICIVSKPPAPAVAEKVLKALAAADKPAVVLFLGSDLKSPNQAIEMVGTMVDAAATAVKAAKVKPAAPAAYAVPQRPRFAASQKHLRALYSGGTYCSEAQVLWAKAGLSVWSNIPLNKDLALDNPKHTSRDHTALDLGDDDFTVGRPHPMIDQRARIERLLQEARDPSVAVIVLDVVIGWGAHADPAGELAPVIAEAKSLASQAGRHLAVVGFVCGTELDPQVLSAQEAKLQAAGMVLAGNSANAAWLAGEWVR
jgi:succinyl-CoA synthetase alpha subunit